MTRGSVRLLTADRLLRAIFQKTFSPAPPGWSEKLIRLLFLFPAQDALVNGFAAWEAFFLAVPALNHVFALFPAQQDDLIIHLAGKIEQPPVQIFHFDAARGNFHQAVLG